MWLVLEQPERPGSCVLALALAEGTLLVGRGDDCQVALLGRRISRRHLTVERRGAAVHFTEAEGATGTLLNGTPARSGALRVGDRLALGGCVLRLEAARPQEQPAAEPQPAALGAAVDAAVPFQAFLEALRTTREPRDLVGRLLAGLADLLGAERGYVLLQERPGAELVPVASHHLADPEAFVQVSRTVVRLALEAAATVAIADSLRDPRLAGAPSLADAAAARAILCCPLLADGQTFGVVYLDHPVAPGTLAPHRLRLFETVTGLASQLLAAGRTRQDLMTARGCLEALRALGDDDEELVAGPSEASRRLQELVETAAEQDVTVLVTGETGTGKERVARALHRRSPRRGGPFVPVNCAALPADLAEAELFGVERGAYTGASERRVGRFELAAGGTLFLDEVGELSQDVQVKLLRVLQERTLTRVGGNEPVPLDFRLVAATNVDVEAAVREGRLRSDLYYRLNVFRLAVPPLRERREDIVPLARHFLRTFAARFRRRLTGLAPEAERALVDYPWPGNVRELRNALERAALLERSELVQAASLPLDAAASRGARGSAPAPRVDDFEAALATFERAFFTELLERHGGNVVAATKASGLARSSFYRHLGKLGLIKGVS